MVFTILLYDNNKTDIKELLKDKEDLKKISLCKKIIENQSISINMNNFLENLVQKLKFSFEDIANANQDNPNYLRINLFTEQNINNKKKEFLICPQIICIFLIFTYISLLVYVYIKYCNY